MTAEVVHTVTINDLTLPIGAWFFVAVCVLFFCLLFFAIVWKSWDYPTKDD